MTGPTISLPEASFFLVVGVVTVALNLVSSLRSTGVLSMTANKCLGAWRNRRYLRKKNDSRAICFIPVVEC